MQIEGEKPKELSKSNWREKHELFQRAVREARMVTQAEKTGGPIPKFQPSGVPSDYVNCPYCARNFNQSAAERHIPFCETQHKRQKMNSNSANVRLNVNNRAAPTRQLQQQQPPQNPRAVQNMYANSNNNYSSGYGSGGGGGYNSGGYSSNYSSGSSSGNKRNQPVVDRKPVRYE